MTTGRMEKVKTRIATLSTGDAARGNTGANVATNASSWRLSTLRMADLITGPSSRTGPVIRQSATKVTRVPSPCRAHT